MDWLGAAISAVASLVTSFWTSSQNKKNVERTNQMQMDMMNQQNLFNESMMERQNEVNSLQNQVKQMNEAGLNPSFMFQSGGTAQGVSPASSAGLAQLTPPQFDGSGIAESFYRNIELKNQTMKAQADVKEQGAKTEGMEIANKYADELAQRQLKYLDSQTDMTDSQRDLNRQRVETEKANYIHTMESVNNLRYEQQLLEEKIKTSPVERMKLQSEIVRSMSMLKFDMAESASRAGLNSAQSKVALETVKKVREETINLVKSGQLIDQQKIHQIIDNALYSSDADRKISDNAFLLDSPLRSFIYSQCDGVIGNAIKSVDAALYGVTNEFGNKVGLSDSKDRRNNYFNGASFPYHPRGSSWSNPR